MASITKRNGKWQYRVSYKHEGKYKNKTRGGFPTKKEATLAASELEKSLHYGFDVLANEKLFADYFKEWFETYKEGKNSPANDKHYKLAIAFCRKYFSLLRLKDITKNDYQKALNDYAKNHAKETVRKRHIYIKACVTDALHEGIIKKDFTYKVEIGGKSSKQENLKFLNEHELKLLINEIEKIQVKSVSHYAILFAISTGARFAEIAGLTWDCVKKESVSICKTFDAKFLHDFTNTKNYASNRTITIDKKTNNLLNELRFMQHTKLNKRNLVFTQNYNEPITNAAGVSIKP